MKNDLYVVEPVKPGINMAVYPQAFITGIDENRLFDYYFTYHPGKDHADWNDLNEYFSSKGLRVRKKYW